MKRSVIQDNITQRVLSELKTGAAPWIKPWAGGIRMPHNAITKRRYRGINVILLMLEAEAKGWSNEWMTLNQIRKSGAWLNKKNLSDYTTILFFEPRKGENKETGETYTYFYTKEWKVYNISQLEQQPTKLYKPSCKNFGTSESELCTQLIAKLRRSDAVIKDDGGDRAYYSLKTDSVHMPLLSSFKGPRQYEATLAHEMAHWTGAKSRLNRFGNKSVKAYAFEELVAEMSAAFIMAEFGLIHDELRHAGYIQSWIELLTDNPKAFSQACSKATAVVDYLIPEEHTDGEK